ncbi:hypothetical protein ID867_17115, partial [Streptomyces parvulus]|nr:hypothetical protein [Streptomyces parvulus]
CCWWRARTCCPRPVNAGVVVLALGLLVWSFGRDVVWLWRTSRTAARPSVTGRTAARKLVAP